MRGKNLGTTALETQMKGPWKNVSLIKKKRKKKKKRKGNIYHLVINNKNGFEKRFKTLRCINGMTSGHDAMYF